MIDEARYGGMLIETSSKRLPITKSNTTPPPRNLLDELNNPFDYQVGDTRVVINPSGYLQETPMPGFSVMKTIEVE